MNESPMPAARKTLGALLAALAVAVASPAVRAQPAVGRGEVAPTSPASATSSPASSPLPPAPAEGGTANAGEQSPTEPPLAPDPGPAPLPVAPQSQDQAASWFAHAPIMMSSGQGEKRWSLTLYGFVEADYIVDSTRSYGDASGSSLVARSDTYEGRVGRTQFSMRNTRLGLAFESPAVGGIKPFSVIEGDFFGHQPDPRAHGGSNSEAEFYASPGFRVRHAYVKLQNAYVDVLLGQTYDLFGWQNAFFPCTAQFLGIPNQVFSRNTQLRLSHSFNAGGAVSLDVAVAATRPGQRDSQVPDGNAGLRLNVNGWRGITTPGNVGTVAMPLSVGVSSTVRQFKVNAFTPPPAQRSNHATGWGVSLDALIPVIPAASEGDRGNRLTLTGSFVVGTGIADLITAGGGAAFPTLPNPAQANPPPLYDPDIDNGLVSFDTQGVLHTIDWQAFRAGLQYYLPPTGRIIFSVNYTQAHSKNLAKLFPKGGAEIELLGSVADTSRYADANLFFDVTPVVRMGLSAQYTQVEYLDGNKPHNLRGMGQALYVF